MIREPISCRKDWQEKLLSQGMNYYEMYNCIYWDESVCYRFQEKQIDTLEAATNELHAMCLAAVDHVVSHDLFTSFHIPDNYIPYIKRSWERQDPAVFGRFDFSYNGIDPPKMLEYNADTPAMLPETSVLQWFWLNDQIEQGALPPEADQFNKLHEELLKVWQKLAPLFAEKGPLYFAVNLLKKDGIITNVEEYHNLLYMRDVCHQAGLPTELIDVPDIGWNGITFTDLAEQPISALYKLYSWEFIAREAFAQPIIQADIAIIEPVWKMLLDNKAILPILWQLFEGHPNLLPAYLEPGPIEGPYIKKPLLGREGGNVTLFRPDESPLSLEGPYGKEGYVYQAYHPMPEFDGNYPVIGSWVVGDKACGIGMRDDDTPITGKKSRFVPHYIYDGEK